jgi:hypothetical protein
MTVAPAISLGHDFQPAPSGLYLPAAHIAAPRPVAIDLFAGAGGFSLGMHHAGWHVAAAVEIDKHAAATYLCNLGSPDTRLHRLSDGQWTDELAGDVMPDLPGSGWIAHRGAPWRREDYPNDYLYEISQPPAADEPACEHFYLGDIRALTGQQILTDLGLQVGEVSAHHRRPALPRLLDGRAARRHGPPQQPGLRVLPARARGQPQDVRDGERARRATTRPSTVDNAQRDDTEQLDLFATD